MRGTEPGTKGAETFTLGGEVWTVSYHHDRERNRYVVEESASMIVDEADPRRSRVLTTKVERYAPAPRGGTTTVCATMKSSPESADVEVVMRFAAKVRCRSTEPYQPGVGRMLGLAEIFTAIAMRNAMPYSIVEFMYAWTAYFERHPADRRLSRYAHEIDARVPDMAPPVARVTGMDFSPEIRATLRAGRAQRRATKKALRSGPLDFGTAASDCGLE